MSILSAPLSQFPQDLPLSPSAKVWVVTENIEDVARILALCQRGDVVFIDIDDTLQTISSYLFQSTSCDPLSEGGRMIDAMKTKDYSEGNASFAAFISRWRLSRRIQLVHERWPSLIAQWRERGLLVYGLTHMDTGPCGVMSRIEEWRYHELSQLGIAFTPTYLEQSSVRLMDLPEDSGDSPPLFHRGIFFTGSLCKDKKTVLKEFLKHNTAQRILLIDDRVQQIQSLQDMEFGCLFTGIIFRGVDRVIRPDMDPEVREKIVELQREYLKNEEWLENEEALAMIQWQESPEDS